ncbi:COP9 signalosome catalytic subunit rri1 [Tilletia horrida]|uniref:COP9 signalosome complex subunit 5 n=1 Tax=Tilletia horrida TaxID=155126 RepID=A0AAN6JI28_9BASI|nr:COP9 signalosome catalytic subunit rri1 [Tilletia horrida]
MADDAAAAAASAATTAQRNFELANAVTTLDPTLDRVFHYNSDEQRRVLTDAPWRQDPHYFRRVRISAVALIKMVMHARSGGIYEVMGIMQGKIDPETRTIYVMDSYALPVQGTETRVSAANEAIEYMVQYSQLSETVGRFENAVGWYHSHPGYGCWLSGIDVDTQRNNQMHQDPFVAVVIDPNRTMSAGRVDIGAFRTYPPGYTPPADKAGGSGAGAGAGASTSVPQSKIEDFGVHANAYYPLEVEHFKSSLDTQLLALLWNKYWVSTLSSSSLLSNRRYEVGQVRDVADQLIRARQLVQTRGPTANGIAIKDIPLAAKESTRSAVAAAAAKEQEDGGVGSSAAAGPSSSAGSKAHGKARALSGASASASAAASASAQGGATEDIDEAALADMPATSGPAAPDATAGGAGKSSGAAGSGSGEQEGGESKEAQLAAYKNHVEAHLAEIRKREEASKLTKVARDSHKICDEAEHGLLSTVLRDVLFNGHATGVAPPPPLS